MPFSPLGRGFLTGRSTAARRSTPSDFRRGCRASRGGARGQPGDRRPGARGGRAPRRHAGAGRARVGAGPGRARRPDPGHAAARATSRRTPAPRRVALERRGLAELDALPPGGRRAVLTASALPTPWQGPMQRADRIIVAGLAVAGLLQGSCCCRCSRRWSPRTPRCWSSCAVDGVDRQHGRPRAHRPDVVASPSARRAELMMFDWVFWWAGRRWGDASSSACWAATKTGSAGSRACTASSAGRAVRRRARRPPPVPSALVTRRSATAACGCGVPAAGPPRHAAVDRAARDARLRAGRDSAVDVVDAVSHYALWVTLADRGDLHGPVRPRGRGGRAGR